MTNIKDLFDLTELQRAIDGGFVTARPSRTAPGVVVYNYTPQAAYAGEWNDVTMTCRGLVTNAEGTVLGRGFEKFYNYQEHDPATLDMNSPVTVMDKLDGSLGIPYPHDGQVRISTRGSADSDQALHATEVLQRRYPHFEPQDADVTPLFEIIYPANRIVLGYDYDDLVLLGGVHNTTGEWIHPDKIANWDGPRTELLTDGQITLEEALSLPDRDRREGTVIHIDTQGLLIKSKQQDYVELHKIATDFNPRRVWEALSSGRIDEYLPALPDELHAEASAITDDLRDAYTQQVAHYKEHAGAAQKLKAAGADRKTIAVQVQTHVHPDWRRIVMQGVVAGHPIERHLWEKVRPAA